MGRCVGLSSSWLNVTPGTFYPVEWPVPQVWTGRGRWRDGPMHTFVDDWRQEAFWRRPQEGAMVAIAAGDCTAPDFTVYTNDPEPWRRFQAWRSAMVAGYWSSWGVRVMPVVSFASGCHEYVRPGSTWAIRGPARSDAGEWLRQVSAFVELARVGRLVVFGRYLVELEQVPCVLVNRPLNVRSSAQAA
jgi:hypothetical protein